MKMNTLIKGLKVLTLTTVLAFAFQITGWATVFTVISASDGSSGPNTSCTLRYAMTTAVSGDFIEFAVPNTDRCYSNNVINFQPATALPALKGGVTIDGTTEIANIFGGVNPNNNGDPYAPIIMINGSLAGAVDGITLNGGNNVVRGLNIGAFNAASGNTSDIRINSSSNSVTGCYFGLNAAGTAAAAALNSGAPYSIYINSGSYNQIGGTNAGDRNDI